VNGLLQSDLDRMASGVPLMFRDDFPDVLHRHFFGEIDALHTVLL
jgi:hypothetical protein